MIESCAASCEDEGASAAAPSAQAVPDAPINAAPADAVRVDAELAKAEPEAPKAEPKAEPKAPGSAWSLTQVSPGALAPPPVPARGAGKGADPRPAPAQMHDTTAPEPAPEPAKSQPTKSQSAPEPALRPAGAPPVSPSALEKLRQIPTSELSLVQMVERFAGALHDHQNSARVRGDLAQNGRDAALAEALKALTLFTESGFDPAGHDIGRGAATPQAHQATPRAHPAMPQAHPACRRARLITPSANCARLWPNCNRCAARHRLCSGRHKSQKRLKTTRKSPV